MSFVNLYCKQWLEKPKWRASGRFLIVLQHNDQMISKVSVLNKMGKRVCPVMGQSLDSVSIKVDSLAFHSETLTRKECCILKAHPGKMCSIEESHAGLEQHQCE